MTQSGWRRSCPACWRGCARPSAGRWRSSAAARFTMSCRLSRSTISALPRSTARGCNCPEAPWRSIPRPCRSAPGGSPRSTTLSRAGRARFSRRRRSGWSSITVRPRTTATRSGPSCAISSRPQPTARSCCRRIWRSKSARRVSGRGTRWTASCGSLPSRAASPVFIGDDVTDEEGNGRGRRPWRGGAACRP